MLSAARYRRKTLAERVPKPPEHRPTCGVGYLFQQVSHGRNNSLQCVAMRHRYLEPKDVIEDGEHQKGTSVYRIKHFGATFE